MIMGGDQGAGATVPLEHALAATELITFVKWLIVSSL
jgi:hypothetical protein